MSSIAGFFHPFYDFTIDTSLTESTCESMLHALSRRGPNDDSSLVTPPGVLLHTALYLSTSSQNIQPARGQGNQRHLSITYDGNIYNMPELKARLHSRHIDTTNLNDCGILIALFYLYGVKFVNLLRGGFAIAILDEFHHRLYLFRDPMGIKPLFFHLANGTLVFASELKGIFAYPDVSAKLDLRGLNEIFSLGPARSPGNGIYKDMLEVKPGHVVTYAKEGFHDIAYWHLESRPHRESYEDTIEHIRFLLEDAIARQLPENPKDAAYVCSFLSGGLDSSIVSAMVNEQFQKRYQQPLTTFSFDFTDSRKYFQANDFQPSLDRPFVIAMAEHLHSQHAFLECSSEDQSNLLSDAVIAHDTPCMADISSSLIHFCRRTATMSRVAFTGECADEIFCGYPWYHKDRLRNASTFPWTMDLHPRRMLLKQDFLDELHMEEYVSQAYQSTCEKVTYLVEDSPDNRLHRKLFMLTTNWFMQTLLDRMDRAAAYSGISACVPFADLPLVEYLYNVPWEMKCKNGEVKHLLREVSKPYLPKTIIERKKSPYPKNYNPAYEQILITKFKQLLSDKNSPILEFIDAGKVLDFCEQRKDYGSPWFGQLMAGPQLLAYYLQIDFCLRNYHVKIEK